MKSTIAVSVVLVCMGFSIAQGGYSTPQQANSGTWALYNFDNYVTNPTAGTCMVYNSVGAPYGNSATDLYCREGYNPENGTPLSGINLVDSMSGFGKAVAFDGLSSHDMSRSAYYYTSKTVNIDLWAYIDPTMDSSAGAKNWLFSIQGVFRTYFDYSTSTNGTARFNIVAYANSGSGLPTLKMANLPKGEWLHFNMGWLNGQVFATITAQDGTTVSSVKYDVSGRDLKQLAGGTKFWIGNEGDAVSAATFKGMIDDIHVSSIPEPATMCLLGLGCLLMGRRKN